MGKFTCSVCKETKFHKEVHTTGYGRNEKGDIVCYACCGETDKRWMIEKGRIALYLTGKNGEYTVCNWPGSIKFIPYRVRKGRHNIAGTRTDVWFKGPDNKVWHGVQYGEFTQICHCKRMKGK